MRAYNNTLLKMQQARPVTWVSSLYFMQGINYAVISMLSIVFFKNLGISNATNTLYASLLLLPWSLKPLWAPLLEVLSDKAKPALFFQLASMLVFILLAMSLFSSHRLLLYVALFFMVALAGALYDTVSDCVYLDNLTHTEQAKYVGVRSIFYQLARFTCQGGLLALLGLLSQHVAIMRAWQGVFICIALIVGLLFIYQWYLLPNKGYKPTALSIQQHFTGVIKAFFKMPYFIGFMGFLLIYNYTQTQLLKVVPLFMLAPYKEQGLNLSLAQLGVIDGLLGVGAMILGSLVAGWWLSKITLRQGLLWLNLVCVLLQFNCLWLSYHAHTSLTVIMLCICSVQFGFGLSTSCYLVYLMRRVKTQYYKMSFFSLGVAIMVLANSIASAISGYLQQLLGFQEFFWQVVVAAVIIFCYVLWVRVYDKTLQDI